MKRVILVRHAKAEHDGNFNSDSERCLSERGEKDAALVASKFKKIGIKVESIYSSNATRALTTAKIFTTALDWNIENINIDSSIYNNGMASIRELILLLDDKIESVMFFGHNPDFSILANLFSKYFNESLPTCGLLCLEFDIKKWKDIDKKLGSVLCFLYPKLYK